MVLLPSTQLLALHSLTLLVVSYYLFTSPSTLLSSGPIWMIGESMHVRAATFSPHGPSSSPGQKLRGGTLHDAPALAEQLAASLSSFSSSSAASPKDFPVSETLAVLGLVVVIGAITQFILIGELGLSGLKGAVEASTKKTPAGVPTPSSPTMPANMEHTRNAIRLGEEVHTLHSAQGRWMAISVVRVLLMALLLVWIYLFHTDVAFNGESVVGASASVMGLLANRVVFTGAMVDMLFWGYLYTVIKEENREIAIMIAKWRETAQREDME